MKILSFRKTTFVNIVLIFISYVPNTLFHFKEFFSQSKYFHEYIIHNGDFPGGAIGKELTANAGNLKDARLIPG